MADSAREKEHELLNALFKALVEAGYEIDIDDGEDRPAECSQDVKELSENVGHTDEEEIYARKGNDSAQVNAWFFLVWGNAPDELIADYSGPKEIDEMYTRIHLEVFGD